MHRDKLGKKKRKKKSAQSLSFTKFDTLMHFLWSLIISNYQSLSREHASGTFPMLNYKINYLLMILSAVPFVYRKPKW